MTIKKYKGNFNFVNPGTYLTIKLWICIKSILIQIIRMKILPVEEQDQILKARRANAELDASKLLKLYPHISQY